MRRTRVNRVPAGITSLGALTPRIPLARPDLGPRELELVTQVLTGDVLAMGPFTERFEKGIASLAERAHGVACSSGTAGLHLAVRALGIEAGHEVITTPFSFVASVNCFLYEARNRSSSTLRRTVSGWIRTSSPAQRPPVPGRSCPSRYSAGPAGSTDRATGAQCGLGHH
jgi:DegT/DnrJ/EryC1/StrS aminotransferase family